MRPHMTTEGAVPPSWPRNSCITREASASVHVPAIAAYLQVKRSRCPSPSLPEYLYSKQELFCQFSMCPSAQACIFTPLSYTITSHLFQHSFIATQAVLAEHSLPSLIVHHLRFCIYLQKHHPLVYSNRA